MGAPKGNKHGLKHGMWGTSEYKTWDSMISRCRRPKSISFPNYGGRGIKVCDRWSGFENFYADMGPKTSSKHTLDRIDNNGDYTPENCRGATRAERARNTRRNRIIEYQGKKYCFSDLAAKFGIHNDTLSIRLKLGWPLEKALKQPIDQDIYNKFHGHRRAG